MLKILRIDFIYGSIDLNAKDIQGTFKRYANSMR